MKKWIGLLALVTAANSVFATSLFEPFNEPVGALSSDVAPNGKIWEPVGTGVPGVKVITGNLIYPNIVAPTGNEVTFGTSVTGGASGDADRVDIGGYNSGAVYFSMEFDVTSTTASTAVGFVAGFSNSIGTSTGTTSTTSFRLYTRPDPTNSANFDLGLGINAVPTTYSAALTPGTTYLIVGEWAAGGAANLWIDPASSTFGTDDQPTSSPITGGYQNITGGTDPNAGITGYKTESFFVRQNTSSPSAMSVDEVRVGGTYASVTAVEWTSTSGNTFDNAGNWSSNTVPGGQGADITFGTNATVTDVTLDSSQTAGVIRFNGTNGYTIGGTSTLTLDTPTGGDLNIGTDAGTGVSGPNGAAYIASAANPAQIIVTATSNVTHTISTPLYLNRSTALTVPTGSTLDLTGGVSANTGTTAGVWLSLGGGGSAVITPASSSAFSGAGGVGLTGLSVNGNLKFTPAHALILLNTGTPTVTSSDKTVYNNTITTFNMTAGSTLDLTNNDLIVNRQAGDGTTETAILNAVEHAYDQGKWDQTGITSSTAAVTPGTALAYVDNALLSTPLTTVDGQTVTNTSIVVKYTWDGDLNLDGFVNGADLAMMGVVNSTSPSNPGYPGWASGDLNYDGVINADDYALFQLGAEESNGGSISSVPEPSAALALAAIGIVAARRRRAVS